MIHMHLAWGAAAHDSQLTWQPPSHPQFHQAKKAKLSCLAGFAATVMSFSLEAKSVDGQRQSLHEMMLPKQVLPWAASSQDKNRLRMLGSFRNHLTVLNMMNVLVVISSISSSSLTHSKSNSVTVHQIEANEQQTTVKGTSEFHQQRSWEQQEKLQHKAAIQSDLPSKPTGFSIGKHVVHASSFKSMSTTVDSMVQSSSTVKSMSATVDSTVDPMIPMGALSVLLVSLISAAARGCRRATLSTTYYVMSRYFFQKKMTSDEIFFQMFPPKDTSCVCHNDRG